jgi:hypothetical protein
LLARRRQPWRGIFVVAALPCFVFALAGWEYGAFPPYAALASICLFQALWPTLLVWGAILAIYATASAVYLYLMAADLIGLARGNQPSIFLGPADDTVFVLLVVVLLAVDVALVLHRPKPLIEA